MAILDVKMSIQPLLDTGECSGQTVSDHVLEQHNLKPMFLLLVNGYTLDDCLEKLKQKIQDFNNGS
jgi:hypothetical protein